MPADMIKKTDQKPRPQNKNLKRDAGPGRPKGLPNKATVEFKEAVNNLIAFATPQMVDWLELVAVEDPNKALDHVYKFAQFGYPLLARSEHTGAGGGAMESTIKVEFVNNQDTK